MYLVRKKTWYEAYAMRTKANPRHTEMFNSLPSKNVWEKIMDFSFHEFVEKCTKLTLQEQLVIGSRDNSHATYNHSTSCVDNCVSRRCPIQQVPLEPETLQRQIPVLPLTSPSHRNLRMKTIPI